MSHCPRFYAARKLSLYLRLAVRIGGPGLRSVWRALKLVFLERLERRRAAAQDVVAGDPVEDMDTVVVQQGGLGHGAFGAGAALLTLLERFGADFLDRFEAVAFGAFVFVKRHDRC